MQGFRKYKRPDNFRLVALTNFCAVVLVWPNLLQLHDLTPLKRWQCSFETRDESFYHAQTV
jgi:hypothetical protein